MRDIDDHAPFLPTALTPSSLLGSGIEDMARRNHHKHRPDVIGAYSANTNGGDMAFSA